MWCLKATLPLVVIIFSTLTHNYWHKTGRLLVKPSLSNVVFLNILLAIVRKKRLYHFLNLGAISARFFIHRTPKYRANTLLPFL
jgi:hypothetical protein